MISWFKKLFSRQPVTIKPEDVDHPDQMVRDAVAQCFNTGCMVIAKRDENGKVTAKVLYERED